MLEVSQAQKTTCMRDYIKPCLRENSPEHVVLHVGTNDLPSVKPGDSIASSIITLAQEVFFYLFYLFQFFN